MKASKASSSSSSSNPNWALLPNDMLCLVLNKLMLLSDMFSFSAVCTKWNSVARESFRQLNLRPHNMFIRPNVPVLLIPSTQDNELIRNLYNVSTFEVHDVRLQVPYRKRFCGSSHGWLITLADVSFEVILVNPFYFGDTNERVIRLPQFTPAIELYNELGPIFDVEYYIHKAILSADPISFPNDFVVMVIYGDAKNLAYWKSGAETWTVINLLFPQFLDVIYSQGQFLAVNIAGEVYSCEITHDGPVLTTISRTLWLCLGTCARRYIVILPDHTILQVIRALQRCACFTNGPITTNQFYVFQLVNRGFESRWIPIVTWNDGAIFVGDCDSLFVRYLNFPGGLENSIYFIDDNHDRVGVRFNQYQLAATCEPRAASEIQRYYHPTLEHHPRLPSPIWILPTI